MHLIAMYKSQYSNIPEVKLSKLSILGEYETESLYFEENESQILQNILIQETEYKKVYNSKNSSVNDFLAFLPSNLTLSGTCLINPENKIFEASIYDSIEVVSFIRSPLRLSLDSISIKDTVEHDLGDEKENLDNSNRASIISKITNGLPLSIDAYISIVDDEFQNIVRKKVTVSSATILSDLEYSPVLTESEILLDSLDLANISKSFYVIYDLRLKGNKNQLVTFKTTDGIDIKSFLNLDYRIKED